MSKILKIQCGLILILAAAFPLWHDTAEKAAAQGKEMITGTLIVKWVDPAPGSTLPALTEFYLRDDAGRDVRLAVEEADIERIGGISRLMNRTVKIVSGSLERRSPSDTTPLVVESIEPVDSIQNANRSSSAVTGNKRFVNILCRFSDNPAEPVKPSYYDRLFREEYPGLGQYWREVSYDQINVEGSISRGWYVLPYLQSSYNPQNFARDCAQAADADVYFPDYFGVNFIINADLRPGYGGEAGSFVSSLDGVTRTYAATWIYRSGLEHQGLVAHEMGHTFGLPHSNGGHGNDYDSNWDVMSYPYSSPYIQGFGSVAQHTISAYKDQLGWIPETHRFIPPPSGAEEITISSLAAGPVGRNTYLMAKIPIQQLSHYYTVEVRDFTGYDQYLPAQAVVIHKHNGSFATVVDADGNNNPNDAGAQWTVGETFEDAANHVRVTINSEDYGFYNVTVDRTFGCTYALSSTGANFPATGGNGSVEVITQPGCPWSLSGAGTYHSAGADGFQIYDAPVRASFVGLAEHYPSIVTIGGFNGPVTKARVTVGRFGHSSPGDIDMILVAPNGVASMLMSDANGSLGPPYSSLVFDQFAAAPLNQSGTNPSGTYQPTDYGSGNDIFPLPGPGTGTFPANLDLFNGLNGNGDWKLFVVDDNHGGTGNLAGWDLELANTPVVTEQTSGFGTTTVNYAVTANYGRVRFFTLTIAGQTFTISQM